MFNLHQRKRRYAALAAEGNLDKRRYAVPSRNPQRQRSRGVNRDSFLGICAQRRERFNPDSRRQHHRRILLHHAPHPLPCD